MTYIQEQLSLFQVPVIKEQKGNTNLIKYGIEEEQSNYRIHVCGIFNIAYSFNSESMIDFINANNFSSRDVYSYGVVTAKGFLVPLKKSIQVGIVKEHILPSYIWSNCPDSSERNKGIWAVGVARKSIENNIVTFESSIKTQEIHTLVEQINGKDILVVNNKISVQVKCDLRACFKNHHQKGTGNLFIQTHECNPTKQY